MYSKRYPPSFRISQNRGEGLISHGTRQWTDYEVKSDIVIHLGNYGGVALRVQGLRRYYGVRLTREGNLQIVRVRDDETSVLAETTFPLEFDKKLAVTARVCGTPSRRPSMTSRSAPRFLTSTPSGMAVLAYSSTRGLCLADAVCITG